MLAWESRLIHAPTPRNAAFRHSQPQPHHLIHQAASPDNRKKTKNQIRLISPPATSIGTVFPIVMEYTESSTAPAPNRCTRADSVTAPACRFHQRGVGLFVSGFVRLGNSEDGDNNHSNDGCNIDNDIDTAGGKCAARDLLLASRIVHLMGKVWVQAKGAHPAISSLRNPAKPS